MMTIEQLNSMADVGNPEAFRQKKKTGQGGILSSLLPTIGGGIGSVAGLALGPLGVAGGGAVGSGLGEFLRQQLSGEDTDLGSVAREGVFGAIPGAAGTIGAAKAAVKGGGGFADMARATIGKTPRAPQLPLPETPTPAPAVQSPDFDAPAFMRKGLQSGMPEVPAMPSRYNTPFVKPQQPVTADIPSPVTPTTVTPTPAPVLDPAKGARQAAQAASGTTESYLQKVNKGAKRMDAQQSGIQVGATLRGETITPDKASQLYEFQRNGAQKYGGIRAGAPAQQAEDAQNVFNNVKGTLQSELQAINRPVDPSELQTITSNVASKVASDAAVTRATTTSNKFVDKINDAKSIDELEKIRMEADDLAYTSRGAGKTSAAAQARAVREAIDDFVAPLSPTYKAVKADYTAARDTLELTSKGSKNAKGIELFGNNVAPQAIAGAKSKGANIAANVTGGATETGAAKKGGFRPFIKPTLQQGGVRAGSALLFGTPFVGGSAPESQASNETVAPVPGGIQAPEQPSQSQSYYEAAQRAIQAGDMKSAETLMGLAETSAKFESMGQQKPLSTAAAKDIANAQTGIDALDYMQGALQKDPSAQGKSALSGIFNPFGITSAALGTGEYEAGRQQAIDVIARLRTGAQINDEEAARFMAMLPQELDDAATSQQKIAQLRKMFSIVADRSNTGSSPVDVTAY